MKRIFQWAILANMIIGCQCQSSTHKKQSSMEEDQDMDDQQQSDQGQNTSAAPSQKEEPIISHTAQPEESKSLSE